MSLFKILIVPERKTLIWAKVCKLTLTHGFCQIRLAAYIQGLKGQSTQYMHKLVSIICVVYDVKKDC